MKPEMCVWESSLLVCIGFTMQTFLLRWFVEHKMATVQSHLKDYHRHTLSIYYDMMMRWKQIHTGGDMVRLHSNSSALQLTVNNH